MYPAGLVINVPEVNQAPKINMSIFISLAGIFKGLLAMESRIQIYAGFQRYQNIGIIDFKKGNDGDIDKKDRLVVYLSG